MMGQVPVLHSVCFGDFQYQQRCECNVCLYLFISEDQLPAGFPNIDMGPQLKVVERSRTATMLCAASGTPDPEITWFKDFLPIDTHTHGRIKQLRSGVCALKDLQSLFSYSRHLFKGALS